MSNVYIHVHILTVNLFGSYFTGELRTTWQIFTEQSTIHSTPTHLRTFTLVCVSLRVKIENKCFNFLLTHLR